jgi:glycosyltransferase involved in cell wall biosynthesis
MRIGIDARELGGRATGVGRYLSGVLLEWQAARVPHEFVLYAPGPIGIPVDTRRFATRLVPGSGGTWWEQVSLPRATEADHLDVWFAPAYTAPIRLTIPIVAAIHDVSFVAHPEWFGIREGMRRRWLVRRTAHQASAVVTISRFSRHELVDRLNVSADRIHVIPPGIGQPGELSARPFPQPPGRRVSQAPASFRVLYVGSIFNRRHVVDLIRAFAPIGRTRADTVLDIVGDNRSHPRQDLRRAITAEGLDDRIRWHEYVTDEELHQLYAGARAFAFLSEYEGLGLTPLEALAAGVPPVLLDTPVARESCGDAAVYVPRHDLAAVTSAIEAVLFDEALRHRLLAAAPGELAKFSWPRAAAETLAVIERAARL